jgi:hypothetical protein
VAEFGRRTFVLGRKIEEDLDIIDQPALALGGVDGPFEARPLLQRLLRPLLVIPEVGGGDQLLDPVQFRRFTLNVKETSAVP